MTVAPKRRDEAAGGNEPAQDALAVRGEPAEAQDAHLTRDVLVAAAAALNAAAARIGPHSLERPPSSSAGASAVEPPGLSRIARFLRAAVGTEEKRFVIGSVVVPLLVAFALITIGQRMASNYQDWQDRRSRARNTVELLRVAASGLSGQLETLAQQGGAMERLRSERSPLDEYAVVKKTFSQISGASRALPPDTAAMGVQKDLRGQLAVCEESIESYMNCLSTTGLDPSRAPGAQPCTSTFRKNLEREGSCSSVEATAYSLRY